MKKSSEEIFSVILLGTSGVGKSSIAFYLEHCYPPPTNIKPSIAFGISHIEISDSVLGLIDVGGQKKFLDESYHINLNLIPLVLAIQNYKYPVRCMNRRLLFSHYIFLVKSLPGQENFLWASVYNKLYLASYLLSRDKV